MDKTNDVGVIVGRFQVNELHFAHKSLIRYVTNRHKKVILFLGVSNIKTTKNNPLDFEMRKQMILSEFPNLIVLYIADVNNNRDWIKNLERQVNDVVGINSNVILYGGRDSFLKYDLGTKFEIAEYQGDFSCSGTETRKYIGLCVEDNKSFRSGVIWATQNQYDKVVTTVDIAIVNDTSTKILLGRKPNEKQFRFIGGFSDVNSDSFEDDALREVKEETNISIKNLTYICSHKINDWRYKHENDIIKTIFYKGTYCYGTPVAGDDIEEIKWFDINESINIIDIHKPLLYKLIQSLK